MFLYVKCFYHCIYYCRVEEGIVPDVNVNICKYRCPARVLDDFSTLLGLYFYYVILYSISMTSNNTYSVFAALSVLLNAYNYSAAARGWYRCTIYEVIVKVYNNTELYFFVRQ